MDRTETITITTTDTGRRKWKFSELLADPEVSLRWEKVRKYFFLRESTYDMSNRCNLRCRHCYTTSADVPFPGELSHEQAMGGSARSRRPPQATHASSVRVASGAGSFIALPPPARPGAAGRAR